MHMHTGLDSGLAHFYKSSLRKALQKPRPGIYRSLIFKEMGDEENFIARPYLFKVVNLGLRTKAGNSWAVSIGWTMKLQSIILEY